ncbi:hypothetical protein SAMN02745823_01975 [Sporobacter termitidis DSM 10068]|uniref:Uncharacterized protein n=1 Tax=Sporobacter termitidis DSM 10068 TaxID=1123282 RepID=A0A1M5XSB7_9FIRM|nr:hypothetical protein SAMN02745823_01975 [Sporobacter termitidis DSM 10068]
MRTFQHQLAGEGESAMKKTTAPKKNRKIIGILLIILGIIGILVPIMPGWIFILAGISML